MSIQEVGQTVRSTVDALKSQPTCLAAIVLAGMFSFLTFMAMQFDREAQRERTIMLIDRCFPLSEKNGD